MSLAEPTALYLLGFLPLFIAVMLLGLRRKRRKVASFHILREVIDSLPLLPPTHLRRRRIQVFLLLLALLLVCLAASGPILGDAPSGPARAIVVLDHTGAQAGGAVRGNLWRAVQRTALAAIGEMRTDDRVLVLRSDGGEVTRGFIAPRAAASLVRTAAPSFLAPRPEAFADHLRLCDETLQPARGTIITPSPARWEETLQDLGGRWRVAAAGGGVAGLNRGILDVEILPDLLRPGRVTVFARVGLYGAPAAGEEDTTKLSLAVNERVLASSTIEVPPGDSAGVVFQDVDAGDGLLTLRLEPSDGFPGDNFFRTPLRTRPLLRTRLVTPGNRALVAALQSIPGVSLDVSGEERDDSPSLRQVTVYDGIVPERIEGSVLLFRPFDSIPGLRLHGEVLRPEMIDADPFHPLLTGVSFDNLRIRSLTAYTPGPALRVAARADGYPFLMAGEGLSGARLVVLAFDPAESSWTHDPSFPILVANMLSWLGLQSTGPGSSFRVGDVVEGEFLRGVESVTNPDGRKQRLAGAPEETFTFLVPGSYRIQGNGGGLSGQVFVNLLNEDISRRAGDTGSAGRAVSPPPPLPFRLEIGSLLFFAAIVLLLVDWAITPAAEVGRLQQ